MMQALDDIQDYKEIRNTYSKEERKIIRESLREAIGSTRVKKNKNFYDILIHG